LRETRKEGSVGAPLEEHQGKKEKIGYIWRSSRDGREKDQSTLASTKKKLEKKGMKDGKHAQAINSSFLPKRRK